MPHYFEWLRHGACNRRKGHGQKFFGALPKSWVALHGLSAARPHLSAVRWRRSCAPLCCGLVPWTKTTFVTRRLPLCSACMLV